MAAARRMRTSSVIAGPPQPTRVRYATWRRCGAGSAQPVCATRARPRAAQAGKVSRTPAVVRRRSRIAASRPAVVTPVVRCATWRRCGAGSARRVYLPRIGSAVTSSITPGRREPRGSVSPWRRCGAGSLQRDRARRAMTKKRGERAVHAIYCANRKFPSSANTTSTLTPLSTVAR